MTYKQFLTEAMHLASKDKNNIFVGYNVRYGSMANGTLKGIPECQLLEMPVAENLVLGTAIGMSLNGMKPIVYIERFDFIMNAMDALVNHLDKIRDISNGEFDPQVLIRVVVGAKRNPLFTGPTHTQDFSYALQSIINIPVVELTPSNVRYLWTHAIQNRKSAIMVEYRDSYETTVL